MISVTSRAPAKGPLRSEGADPTWRSRGTLVDLSSIVVALAAIAWPYFRYLGETFYNRYFEAITIFNPVFTYRTYASGWSDNFHLGYATLLEPSYLSLFSFLILVYHVVGGTEFASRAYPLTIALCTFASMFVYLRTTRPALPVPSRALVCFVFTVNPLTAGMVHEGYSGMMIDYALIPACLALIDGIVACDRPLLLGLLPLVFTATSMFKLPEVAIAWVAIAILRWDRWVAAVRRQPRIGLALLLALAANAYWATPMILNLKIHQFLPIQDDTAGEIALSTEYSTLSNVVFGRVFGYFEYNAHLCLSCGYYSSAAYTLGMALTAILAVTGLVLMRSKTTLWLLVGATVLATGYHYQDDLIGIPYQLIMQLPTFGIFRSSNVFTILVWFCYAVGLSQTLSIAQAISRARFRAVAISMFAATVLVSWPMIDGAIFERQTAIAGTVASPNFFVRIPSEYDAARHVLANYRSDGVSLLMPPEPFASYRWGAYVQDFLPGFLGRPTLQRFYWREPNPDVDALLGTLTNPNVGSKRLAELMSAMRIDSVVVRDDSTDGYVGGADRFGTLAFRQGRLRMYHPTLPIVAPVTEGGAPIAGIGGATQDVPIIETLTGRTVDDAVPRIGCGGDVGFAFIRGASTAHDAIEISSPVACDGRLTVDAYLGNADRGGEAPRLAIFRSVREVGSAPMQRSNDTVVTRYFGRIAVHRGDVVGIVPSTSGLETLALVARSGDRRPILDRPVTLSLFDGMLGTLAPNGDATSLVVHQSSDPSWQAFQWTRGGFHADRKFVADGYANGWAISPGIVVTVVNFAQVAFVAGLALSTVALSCLWYLCIAPYRPLQALRRRARRSRVVTAPS